MAADIPTIRWIASAAKRISRSSPPSVERWNTRHGAGEVAGEQAQAYVSDDQPEKHDPQRVPVIALRTQEDLSHVRRNQQRRPPFQQFPECRYCQHYREDEESQPASALQCSL